jgi:hypothetical protein|tara:strand:+ start:5657 stop:5875 length:219 start_codon:yes stop_codon:yes gene_type:complete
VLPNTAAGTFANSCRLSIATITILAPFSEKISILSAKLIALSIAPSLPKYFLKQQAQFLDFSYKCSHSKLFN